MSDTTHDEMLKNYQKRLRRQYSVEPAFVAVHAHSKTVGGVYEFAVELKPERKVQAFFWTFAPTIAGGQLAMEVGGSPQANDSADAAISRWLAGRNIKETSRSKRG